MEQGEEEEKKSSTKLLQKQFELSAILLAQRLEYMGSEEIPVE